MKDGGFVGMTLAKNSISIVMVVLIEDIRIGASSHVRNFTFFRISLILFQGMFYLNEDFSGGHTVFFDRGGTETYRIIPKTGQCILFFQTSKFPHIGS